MRGRRCWEGDAGKGMCSQSPKVALGVLPGWFFLQSGLTRRVSHGNNFISMFSAQICAGPQQKPSVVFQPGSFLWGAALGAHKPPVLCSFGTFPGRTRNFLPWGWKNPLWTNPLAPVSSKLPPRSVSSGPPMFNEPFYAAGWGIFWGRSLAEEFLSFVRALRTLELPGVEGAARDGRCQLGLGTTTQPLTFSCSSIPRGQNWLETELGPQGEQKPRQLWWLWGSCRAGTLGFHLLSLSLSIIPCPGWVLPREGDVGMLSGDFVTLFSAEWALKGAGAGS